MKIRLSLVLMLAFIATSTFAKEGIYIEFKMTGSKFSGTSKTYSMDGNTRSEMTMTSPAMPAPFTTASLVLHSTPDVVYSIIEKDKTYSELATGTGKSQHKADESDYEVTVIGKELKAGNGNVAFERGDRLGKFYGDKKSIPGRFKIFRRAESQGRRGFCGAHTGE